MLMHASKRLTTLVLAFISIGTGAFAYADEAVPADAEAGVAATISKTNELVARGASAKEMADVLYEQDLTIIGEGEKSLYPNLKSFMKPLAGFLTNPTCRLEVVNKIRHSGNLAVAWVHEHCDAHAAEPVTDYRILYVFRKSSMGWRTTMEMFGVGTF